MKAKILTLLFFIFPSISFAQFDDNYNQIDAEGNMISRNKTNRKDTLKNEKKFQKESKYGR